MVLKRNLPSSFSTRLNPWEEATKPAPQQPEAALRWGQDDEARKPTQAARQPGQGQTMQDRLPQSLIGGGEPAQARQQREPRNLLEAVQAAGRRRGVLPPEPEQEFDFPAIKRATGTLTSIFGRPPREGDIIPAGSVDRYLKSLSADQFDKREDIEFFNHVRDAYRLAYPTTSYDISGRMSDSPPVAIPFKPWGEAKPRSPQGMGAGTGMPGILKASAPAEEEDKPEEPKPRPDEKPEPKDPQPPKPPEDDPKEEEKQEENEQCQYYRNDIAHLKQRLAQTREVLLAQERALRKLEYVRAHLLFTQAMGTVELVGEAASEIAEAFGRRRRRGKGGAAGGPTPPKPPREIKIPPRDKRPGDRGDGQEIVDVLSDAVETAEVTDSLEDIEQKIKYTEEKIDILEQKIKWYIGDIVKAAEKATELGCKIEIPDPSHL